MKILSILTCKLSAFLLSFIGRGSALPGTIALKFDKNILKKLTLPSKVIVVTGSSGKGSTTKIIAHVLKDFGYKVSHNFQGGNETSGIITTLIKDSNLKGKVKSDFVVLEMDERYLKYIMPDLKPTDVVITNITRDQPPRQRHTNFIYNEIKKGLTNKMHLYLNANDPTLVKFALETDAKVTYYAINKLKSSYQENIFNSLNSPRCPKCHHKLNYKYYHFEDIGNYSCSKCGYKMPTPTYRITSFNDKDNIVTIDNNYNINLNNDMLYNLYNTLAAYSVLKNYDLNEEKIAKSISNLNKDKKIFNHYSYKNNKVFVLNNKCENSTTYNQSLLYTLKNKNPKTIVLGWQEISRRYIWDELSWLYDVEFELLKKQKIEKIIVAGPQRYDIAVRLKYAGIDENIIKIHHDLYEAKNDLKTTNSDIYAILNFDYIHDFNTVMEELK